MQRFADREAIDYLEAALALTARLADVDERCRRELELRLTLWPLLNDLYGFGSDRLRENCERAHQLCGLVGTPHQRFHVLYALCHVYGMQADPVRAPAFAAQLDEAADQTGSPECRLLADTALARLAFLQARHREACRVADGLAARRRVNGVDPTRDMVDGLTSAGSLHALALWFLGDRDRAWTSMHAAVAEANAHASLFGKAVVLGHTGLLALFCRQLAEVRAAADQLMGIASEQGFSFYVVVASALHGWARMQLGELDGAIAELEGALAALRPTGSHVLSSYLSAFLSEAHLRAGDVGGGLVAVATGLTIAETTLDRTFWPELYRLKGELLVAGNGAPSVAGRRRRRPERTAPPTDAEQCFLRAVELAREMDAKSLELRAARSLAIYWAEHGRKTEAAEVLQPVCAWFADDTNLDLVDARAVLAGLAGSPRSPQRGGVRKPSLDAN
jgi:hypothetical protein